MKNSFPILRTLTMLGGIAFSNTVFAHEVTLFPEQDRDLIRVVARYGDPGQYEKIYRIRLLSLDSIAPDGKISFLMTTARAVSDELSLEALDRLREGSVNGVWTFSSTYDNGFYVHAADGHAIATTLADYPSAADSAHYLKYSKALLRIGLMSHGYDRILGHRLELVPLANPFSVAVGVSIPIEVLFQGKPLAGATVEIGDDQTARRNPEQKTDSLGIVQVPIDHHGWFRLAVTFRAPSKYPTLFRFDDLDASLVFQHN
jgi:nickel transport protein